MDWLDEVKWDAAGLVPVIAQQVGTNDVLMFAWMDRAALAATAASGEAVYYSRSRRRLWHKGEESGHVQKVQRAPPRLRQRRRAVEGRADWARRTGRGIACHTGRHSCFFQLLKDGAWQSVEPVLKDPRGSTNA